MVLSERAKEARREYMRKYRAENRDRLNAQRREWNKKNPDKVRMYKENYFEKLAERYENERA